MDGNARAEFWAALALRHSAGLGPRSCASLLRFFGSALAVLQATQGNGSGGRQAWSRAGLNRRQAAELERSLSTDAWRAEARREWDAARECEASVLLWTSALYPSRLRELPDAPVLLYCRGDASLLRSPGVAVVGSRRASAHALAVAEHLGRCLSACGITVVSGMAQGIDSAAHTAALGRVGRSIGVLGTGIDRVYPRSGQPLFRAMAKEGLLLSEFAPGTPPLAGNFPIRNRIISGLSLGVVVVEAASRSGSLITARLALEQNREVFAVPGAALDAHCGGCQELVRQGARPVFSAEDIVRELAEALRPFRVDAAALAAEPALLATPRLPDMAVMTAATGGAAENGDGGADAESRTARSHAEPAPAVAEAPARPAPDAADKAVGAQLASSHDRERLLDCLRHCGETDADTLARALDMPVERLSALLVGLELLGEVRRLPGARYEAGS